MRILHITPHLPPDQAANALLPFHLGCWARESGDEVYYLSHPPRAGSGASLPGPARWVPSHRVSGNRLARVTRLASARRAARILGAAFPAIATADVVHLHSNGLLTELGGLVARWRRKPVVLTLYGTEIWHYRPTRVVPDLFTRCYHGAAHVTFYSHALLARAKELGLNRNGLSVVYPPVTNEFSRADAAGQAEAQASLGFGWEHLLLNVKRLHPVGGQIYLVRAMKEVVHQHPDTHLVICGTGPLLGELEQAAQAEDVARHITFAGLVDNRGIARYYRAADVFVLPSVLESLGTVMLEALGCGTPVISSDNAGAVELSGFFPRDIAVVPQADPSALASAISDFLSHKRRTGLPTEEAIERYFRPPAVAAQFREIYQRVLDGHPRS